MFLNIKARNAILLAAFSYCILGSSAVFAGKSNKHESVVYCGFENFSVQKAINKVKHNRKVTIFIGRAVLNKTPQTLLPCRFDCSSGQISCTGAFAPP